MRIAINGFGRIGRAVFKIALDQNLNVVAINDVHGVKDAEYLLKFDSIYGRYEREIRTRGNNLVIGKRVVRVLSERDPSKLPWKSLGVDVVVEATGVFREREKCALHLNSGAKYVVLTAPCRNKADITVVLGVNHNKLKPSHKVISVASCTTNCLVPVVKVLHDKFTIKRALMTTVHGYTNNQALHDSSHKKPRRGRAAALNIVPTTTGAAQSVIEVMPDLLGKITGLAVRVPVPVGSLVDLVAELEKSFTIEQVNNAFKRASKTYLKGVLEYSEDELVSTDIIGNPHSSIVDGLSTQKEGNLVKVLAWYDNEFGYSNRVVDVIKIIKGWLK
ncbi:type I glyceraldehyde-3-phosphate dehydrogenase [Candidatus Pacearchaeota archaeon]|nr:MAG: type I glyceraldehyde-3-phosphate dehydrogenase [Candidatus Pacearchaeota archaeon]